MVMVVVVVVVVEGSEQEEWEEHGVVERVAKEGSRVFHVSA